MDIIKIVASVVAWVSASALAALLGKWIYTIKRGAREHEQTEIKKDIEKNDP